MQKSALKKVCFVDKQDKTGPKNKKVDHVMLPLYDK